MSFGSVRFAAMGFAVALLLAQASAVGALAQTPVASPMEKAIAAGAGTTVTAFYAARSGKTAWTDERGLNVDGQFALGVLRASADEGIDPARYRVDELAAPVAGNEQALAARDVLMTSALLRYAADLLNGRPELRAIDRDVDLPRDNRDLASGLAKAVAGREVGGFFRGLIPESSDYAQLKAMLARYREIDAKGGWGVLPPSRPFHANAADAALLGALKLRLSFEDAALDPALPASADEVDAAIQRFQRRNDMDADGLVGAKTLEMLNVAASERALEVAANMERLRWLPHRLEAVRVVVNVPDARLTILEGDKAVLSSAVIVGKPRTPSPIFRAEVTQVIANPPWNVPAAIARGEILPRVARDPGYLARHNMIIVNGQVRQLPGAKNALGELKVDLNNRFSVYLHDTPSRGLFDRRRRFLSHGCVRVAQIFPLASYALTGDTTAGIAQLVAAVATTGTVHLPVKAPIPVYVIYATVFPSADGLQFRSDIYGRDRRLIAAMTAGRQFARAGENCPRG